MRGRATERTDAINNKIIELFTKGVSKDKIAKELHIETKYVREYLKQQGITKNAWDVRANSDLIIKLIKENKTVREVGELINVPKTTVLRVIKKYNLNYYIHKEFNPNKFHIIDTEEKAYWLGFIYADGYVDQNHLEIGLSDRDIDHLRKFSKFMECKLDYIVENKNYNKKANKEYGVCRISLSDKNLGNDLTNCGLYPKKSMTLCFPNENIVPQHLLSHFIRGYFDGDGSIMSQFTSKVKLAVSIIGSENFIKSLSTILNCSTIVEHATKNGSMYYLNCKVLKSIKFCEYIYKNASIYLDRKKKIWDDFCRSNTKMLEGLRGKFGEDWDVNAEVIDYVNYKRYCNA